ncbi:hypothetical protein ACFL2Q_01670 [Thermodesulfobacteriota bacterium]
MTETKQHKSPQELGEAVGRKIDELFGGLFGDEPDEKPAATDSVSAGPQPQREAVSPPQPAQPASPPRTAPTATKPQQQAPDALLENIEALVLNLEWEMNEQTIRELTRIFRDLGRHLPAQTNVRQIYDMNRRVLARFGTPGATPHPLMVRLFQDSVTVFKEFVRSRAKAPVDQVVFGAISNNYKRIMTTPLAAPHTDATQETEDAGYDQLIKNLGSTLSSFEDLGQRLGKLVGFLRQGGDMPKEEVARRIATLEGMFTERVGRLSSVHGTLSKLDPSAVPGDSGGVTAAQEIEAGPDGVLMVSWYRIPLAIPSSLISALYPLPKAQAQQMAARSTITLANRELKRLPLRKPKSAAQKPPPVPVWLVHMKLLGKDFFLLAERALGYRRSPSGFDLNTQAKMKIGSTSYMLLNENTFR